MTTLIALSHLKVGKTSLLMLGILMLLAMSLRPLSAVQINHGQVDDAGASFLETPPTVRQAALGGDQVAAEGDIETMFSNPAGLTGLIIPELWVMHNQAFLDSKHSNLGLGLPMKKHTFGFSLQYIDDGTQEQLGVDANRDPVTGLGEFKFSTYILQTSWAKRFGEKGSVGLSAKGWREDRKQSSSSGLAFDAGFQWRSLLPRLDVGAAVKNVGPSVDGNDLPTGAAAGLAYHFFYRNAPLVTLFSEYDAARHRDNGVRMGAEVKRSHFWIRAGYETVSPDEVEESLGNLSLGGGLRIKGWTLDYAWIPRGDLGDQHRMAVTIGLGQTPEDRERTARALDKAMQIRMNQYAQTHFEAAEREMKNGKWDKAKRELSKCLQWDPAHNKAKENMGLVTRKATFEEAQGHYQRGKQLSRKQQWLDAASAYQETLKRVPTHKKAKKELANARKHIRYSQKGEKSYQKGVQHYVAGQYEVALTEWKRALKKSPNNPRLLEYIAKAEKMILSQELASVRDHQKTQNSSDDTINQQAYTLYMLGQTEKAVRLWETILIQTPDNKMVEKSLAEAKQKLKMNKGTRESRTDGRVYELSAQAIGAYKKGDLKRSANIWHQILVLDPGNMWIRNNLDRIESELTTKNLESRR